MYVWNKRTNDALVHDSALVRLYWAGDKLGMSRTLLLKSYDERDTVIYMEAHSELTLFKYILKREKYLYYKVSIQLSQVYLVW